MLKLFFFLIISLSITLAGCYERYTPELISPNKRYEAKLKTIRNNKDKHYEIVDLETNQVIFMTHSEYPESINNVKAGGFSCDSEKFAAIYHYSHDGGYSWIGVWDVKAAKFLSSTKIQKEYRTNLTNFFEHCDTNFINQFINNLKTGNIKEVLALVYELNTPITTISFVFSKL